MKDSKLFKNSSFSILQTVVTAIAALLLFKLMVLHAGLKAAGLWSFLASINAITGFGSFGFANALLYYIPKYQLQKDTGKTNSLINTAFLSVLFFTIVLCAVSYGVFSVIIPHTVDAAFITQAFKLLPFVVASFFFSGLSAAYLSVLDGLMLMHTRAKINMAAAVLFLVAGYVLLLRFGIAGIAIAQLAQNVFLLLASVFYVKKHIPYYRFSVVFDKPVFQHIFKYGFNFQVISIAQIISDPFMKSMISRYAGMQVTAIFDFSIKLLSVFKSLLTAANQTIVPQITVYKTMGRQQRVKVFYKANFKLVLFASIIFFLSPVALSDSISIFFLGRPNSDFNFILLVVAIGLLVNTIALPAHFYYLGSGNLKWNVINNVIAAAIIFVFTPIAGELTGNRYMVICWPFSAVVGAIILLWAINKETGVSIFPFLNGNTLALLLLIAVAIVGNHYINQLPALQQSFTGLIAVNTAILFVCLLYPVIKEPMVKKIARRFAKTNWR